MRKVRIASDMTTKLFEKNTGNTLIELLISTFIVGLVLTGVAVSITYSIQNEALNRYRQTASDLADMALEQMAVEREQLGWETFRDKYSINQTNSCFRPNPLPSPNPYPQNMIEAGECNPDGSDSINYNGYDFVIEITTAMPSPPPSPELIKVDVEVTWQISDSQTKTFNRAHEFSET